MCVCVCVSTELLCSEKGNVHISVVEAVGDGLGAVLVRQVQRVRRGHHCCPGGENLQWYSQQDKVQRLRCMINRLQTKCRFDNFSQKS